MLPSNALSSTPVIDEFLYPRNLYRQLLVDQAMGGIALNDASQGMRVQLWTCYLDGNHIMLSAPSVTPFALLTVAGVTELGLAFTQNMSPVVVYIANGQAAFYWFDTLNSMYTTTNLPANTTSPRCALDDDRPLQSSTSDVIIGYVRNSALYFRMQRDRYQIEYLLDANVGVHKLHQIGMNTKLRFQFSLISGVQQ